MLVNTAKTNCNGLKRIKVCFSPINPVPVCLPSGWWLSYMLKTWDTGSFHYVTPPSHLASSSFHPADNRVKRVWRKTRTGTHEWIA